MLYRNRMMVALTEFPHGDYLVRKDETFVATHIDAEYLVSRGRAIYAPEPALAAKVEAPAAPAADVVTAPAAGPAEASPASSDAPDTSAAQAAAEAPAADAAAEPAAEAKHEAAPVAPARRGGRRPAQSTPASE